MNKFPEIAFGKTLERKPEQGTHPDPEVILHPLESEESIAREFCTRCGITAEVTEKFLKNKGVDPENLHSGDYLETDGCPDCQDDSRKEAGTVRVRNIKEFAS